MHNVITLRSMSAFSFTMLKHVYVPLNLCFQQIIMYNYRWSMKEFIITKTSTVWAILHTILPLKQTENGSKWSKSITQTYHLFPCLNCEVFTIKFRRHWTPNLQQRTSDWIILSDTAPANWVFQCKNAIQTTWITLNRWVENQKPAWLSRETKQKLFCTVQL